MHDIDKKLMEMNIVLPEAPMPLANYVSVRNAGNFIFFSGAGPIENGKPLMTGKLGRELVTEDGYMASKEAGKVLLASLKKVLNSNWDNLESIVKINGYVNSSDGFAQQPQVINGVSDLLADVLGEKGKHARTAIGVNALPLNLPIEIEMIVLVKDVTLICL